LKALLLLFLASCGSPGYDSTHTIANSIEIAGSLDLVNVALSSNDCTTARAAIFPLYSSVNSENDIRLAMAATYGCSAGINVFGVISDLTKAQDLGGSGLWKFLVTEFPSTASPDDKKPDTTGLGTDALMAALKPGVIVVSTSQVNWTSDNPGSIDLNDRVEDANSYLTFMAMAQMGALLSRDGAPDATTHVKTVNLPWTTPATVVGDGCSFVSGLLNLLMASTPLLIRFLQMQKIRSTQSPVFCLPVQMLPVP
jgi:hypothetical protein